MGLFDSVKKQLGNAAKTAQKAAENLPDSVRQIDVDKALHGQWYPSRCGGFCQLGRLERQEPYARL